MIFGAIKAICPARVQFSIRNVFLEYYFISTNISTTSMCFYIDEMIYKKVKRLAQTAFRK